MVYSKRPEKPGPLNFVLSSPSGAQQDPILRGHSGHRLVWGYQMLDLVISELALDLKLLLKIERTPD